MEGHQNVQWCQGKAGEDCVHVVVSKEYGWVVVGIYDGFNSPDAPDYLLSKLCKVVHKEFNDACAGCVDQQNNNNMNDEDGSSCATSGAVDSNFDDHDLKRKKCGGNGSGRSSKNKYRGAAKKWEENQMRKTEEAFLDVADKMVMENPKLALMGFDVLVMLMKGEDVYVMNVGDSRVVLA
ncbi:hypothetical protein AHAS_Ahas04G0009800 [Arachis hypogaea]